MRSHLERALQAEEELEEALAKVADLEMRVRAIMQMEPLTAARALAYKSRAEQGEQFIRRVVKHCEGRGEVREQLTDWLTSVEPFLAAGELLKREEEDEDPELKKSEEKYREMPIEGNPVRETFAAPLKSLRDAIFPVLNDIVAGNNRRQSFVSSIDSMFADTLMDEVPPKRRNRNMWLT